MAEKTASKAKATSPGKSAPAATDNGFIARLVTDPNHLPEMVVLLGYPGKSALGGHTRLYFAADLADYYEIPSDAILHTEKAENFPGPPGAAYLWIRRSAEIVRRGRYVADIRKRFFSGSIINDYLIAPGSGSGT